MDLNFEVSQFNSQEFDKETGYYYYNARYYNPVVSRFITPDTIIDGEKRDKNGQVVRVDTQGWNRYSYVKGNPVMYKDPTGHSSSLSLNHGNTDAAFIDSGPDNIKTFKGLAKMIANYSKELNAYIHMMRYKRAFVRIISKRMTDVIMKKVEKAKKDPTYKITSLGIIIDTFNSPMVTEKDGIDIRLPFKIGTIAGGGNIYKMEKVNIKYRQSIQSFIGTDVYYENYIYQIADKWMKGQRSLNRAYKQDYKGYTLNYNIGNITIGIQRDKDLDVITPTDFIRMSIGRDIYDRRHMHPIIEPPFLKNWKIDDEK